MMRLHPGAGIIISWKPDCFPQVMTVIILLQNPLQNKKLENDQPGHIFALDNVIMHDFQPLSQFFSRFQPKAPICTLKVG
jgi:hypothetical protein